MGSNGANVAHAVRRPTRRTGVAECVAMPPRILLSCPRGMQTVGGRYALDGRLGEGGMGQVYRARHLQLGKPFALKIISPAFAEDGAARARFNEEARLASEISHPNIVSVVDFGEDTQFGAYMVMELVEGEPLINEQGAPMSVRRACDIHSQGAGERVLTHLL